MKKPRKPLKITDVQINIQIVQINYTWMSVILLNYFNNLYYLYL